MGDQERGHQRSQGPEGHHPRCRACSTHGLIVLPRLLGLHDVQASAPGSNMPQMNWWRCIVVVCAQPCCLAVMPYEDAV